MRAQRHPSRRGRLVAFTLGLPGTLASFLLVEEGGGSVYGIRLPLSEEER
jgi:hypothetical protein